MAIFEKLHKRSGVRFFYIRFTWTPGRRKKEKAGTTRKQAERLLRKRLGQVASGTYVHPEEMKDKGLTFGDFADRFLDQYVANRRSIYYSNALQPIRRFFEHKRLQDIRRADLDDYTRWRLLTPMGRRRAAASPATVRKDLIVLSTMFRMAVRWGLLDHSPAVSLDLPPAGKPRERYLSRQEYHAVKEAAPPWLLPVLRMALVTGSRLGEVVGLQWENVDRENDILHVWQNKTQRWKHVPLGKVAREILVGQVRHVRSPHIFLDSMGQHYGSQRSRERVSRTTRDLFKALGIKGASFHSLRHTAATWGYPAVKSEDLVAMFLGHARQSMTARYTHLQVPELVPIVEALDEADLTAPAPQSAHQESARAETPPFEQVSETPFRR